MQFIDLKQQYSLYKAEIDEAIHRVLDHGRYIMGDEVRELEAQLADYVGVTQAVTCGSGTDGLLLALMALGVGPGDEVITVPFTWIATAEVIALLGATPVFVDIDPDTYNINIDQMEAAITPNTKAIMPVSLFGQMPDFNRINAIAAARNLPVIEDGAQSFGSTQHGRRSCGVTTIGVTSFFPAKPFGCYGDGGATFTNDEALAAKMRAIRTHGGERRHHHPYVGINARLDTLQAAVLLAKLPHFEKEVEARGRLGARYSELLSGFAVTPVVAEGNTHVYAQYTIRVEDREEVQKALKEQGIPSAVYYPKCLHEQPVFSSLGYALGSFPVSEKASNEVVSLPMHPWLSEEEQNQIVEAVERMLSPVGV